MYTYVFIRNEKNTLTKMKSIPMSVRLSEDEAAFLARLDIAGATTPSDKLRAIISETRKRMDGVEDFSDCAELFRDMLSPTARRIREANKATNMRSELFDRFLEWLPEVAAYFITTLPEENVGKDALRKLESGLADRITAFLEGFLRMGVTSQAPCYDEALVTKRLKMILELAEIAKKQQPNP